MADHAVKLDSRGPGTPDSLTTLPAAYLERMRKFLGEEYAPFLESYEAPSNVGLRVNTLKLSPQGFSRLSPFSLAPSHMPVRCPQRFGVPTNSRAPLGSPL